MDLGHTSAPKRREFFASETSPVMAEQDLARSPGGGGILNRCLGREVRPGRSNPDPV